MRSTTHARNIRWAAAVAATVLAIPLASSPAEPRFASFDRGGLRGSGPASMQQVVLPARIGRVAVVPGSDEAWAIGHSSGRRPGWDVESAAGQVVFLRHTSAGWSFEGPPTDASGRPINPILFAFAFAPDGTGWAVGDAGLILHRAPGATRWVRHPASGRATTAQLSSVSIAPNGDGFAVGVQGTLLRLRDGEWTADDPRPDLAAAPPDLTAVSAVSADDAWAISGSTSDDLRIYHRDGSGWHRILTGRPMFDGPHPAQTTTVTVDAAFGSSVAATRDGAWVGGSIFPSDPANPFGNELPGDRSRPFVVHVDTDGTSTSYCPDQPGLSKTQNGVEIDRTKLCDRAFPLSAFDVTSIAVFPGPEVFAGGMGLYHFADGGWFREPDSNGYLISIAMTSPDEGWMATTGNTYGAGGAVHSSETALGHWTRVPDRPRVARWPQPQANPLEAIALAPDASGRAVAVGADGTIVAYQPGAGWDFVPRVGKGRLHAVAWPAAASAWAVGEGGKIVGFDGEGWSVEHEPGAITPEGLFGLAFRSPSDGYAVGAGGTILRFDSSGWSEDRASGRLTDERLYSIAATPTGYAAVGGGGVVLERDAGGWHLDTTARPLVTHPQLGPADLYAVVALGDGTIFAAGQRSAFVRRDPGSSFEGMDPPLEGTILALAGALDNGGGLRLYASVTPDAAKYRGDTFSATRGVVMVADARGWHDLSLSRRRSTYTSTDSAEFADPTLAIAIEDGATEGWAVGGSPASTPDSDGRLRALPTSSIYRIDLIGNAAPPDVVADVELPEGGFNFAILAETWCGRGLCSPTIGSGTQADLVALQIQREIETATKLAHGPRFVMFAGNGRSVGVPDELHPFKGYLDRFSLPLFGAIGDHDLFAGIDQGTIGAALGTLNVAASGTNDYWKETFADRPQPWGDKGAPPGFLPVRAAGTKDPTPGIARTHYAFDYAPQGRRLLRVVVIDSSTKSYGRPTDQNPEGESQGDWLEKVLTDARGVVGGSGAIPAIVVMNQPTVLPDRAQLPNWIGPDAATFQGTVVRNGVSAVFTGGARMNTRSGFPDPDQVIVPLYVLGGGGAPLGFENPAPTFPSKLPSDGFYNAWHLVHVGPTTPSPAGLPRADVSVTAFPILESLAMHAIDGRAVSGGQTLRFSALARSLTGGGSDPDQAKATYFPVGAGSLIPCDGHGQGNGSCANADAITPPYRFYSEEPDIADFVVPFPADPTQPVLDGGIPRRDPDGRRGLLCTFKAGTAHINVVSGFHRARMAIKVGGGFGPCVRAPVVPPKVETTKVERPVPQRAEPVFSSSFRPQVGQGAVVIFAPPPAPVVAPAPPGSPGVGRKEEHEPSHETEGHGPPNRYGFEAVSGYSAARARAPDPVAQGWLTIGAVVLLAAGGAVLAGARERERPKPQEVRIR